MYRAICMAAALLLSPVLGACCNFDQDTLQSEAAAVPAALDAISGRLERTPPALLEAELRELQAANAETPDNWLRQAELLAALGREEEAAALLSAHPAAAADLKPRADLLRAHLFLRALWRNPQPGPAPSRQALAERGLPYPTALARMAAWICNPPPVRADEMLPDLLALRLAGNKTAIADNEQLAEMDLAGAGALLMALPALHPDWENPDLYYALSLALAVDGKQHLAHFARLRVLELLAAGQNTRLTLPPGLTDLAPLLIPRKLQTGALVEIRALDEPQKSAIAQEYARRREFAGVWLRARQSFLQARLDAGRSPAEADFWQGFVPPVYSPPVTPAVVPAPAPAPATADSPAPQTGPEPASAAPAWSVGGLVGGGAAALMVLVLLALARKRRPGTEPKQP